VHWTGASQIVISALIGKRWKGKGVRDRKSLCGYRDKGEPKCRPQKRLHDHNYIIMCAILTHKQENLWTQLYASAQIVSIGDEMNIKFPNGPAHLWCKQPRVSSMETAPLGVYMMNIRGKPLKCHFFVHLQGFSFSQSELFVIFAVTKGSFAFLGNVICSYHSTGAHLASPK
jgi:hypothetical protein